MAGFGVDLIDAVAGGFIKSDVVSYYDQQRANQLSSMNDYTRSMVEQAHAAYQIVNQTQSMQILRNLQAKMNTTWSPTEILMLKTIEEFRTANLVTQPYIMAHPGLRQRYFDQTVDGYSETYVNHHGDAIGENHYDYRRVMDGVVVVNDAEDPHDYVIRTYLDEGAMFEGDEHRLTVYEQLNILGMWDRIPKLLEEADETGDDFTLV